MTIRIGAIAAATLMLAACSSSPLSSIGSIGSIGGSKVSEQDRVFLAAAGSWDRNRDNSVTCDEWKAYAAELWDGAEANRDGFVDQTEWARVVAVDRMFITADVAYFDANGDGKLTRDEMINKPNPVFTLMDTSKTCALSGAQIAGARSKTEFDVGGKKAQDGDPREAAGEQGRAANGGLGR